MNAEVDASLGRRLRYDPMVSVTELGRSWVDLSDFRLVMEKILAEGWSKSGHFLTDLRPPVDFDGHARSHAADLHAWEPLGYALQAFEALGERAYLDLSCGYAFDWLERYWRPEAWRRSPEELDALLAGSANFAWYDMAVGRRLMRLAYLLDVLARDPETPEARLETLWAATQFHHALLSREHFFRGHNNHGIYQTLGQLSAARRFLHMPESPPQYDLAQERLLRLIDAHVTAEGVHKEHSPSYHLAVTKQLGAALDSGLLTSEAAKARILAMRRAAGWMVMPQAVTAPVGDSDPTPFPTGDPEQAPRIGVAAFPESGYAFARLYAPDAPQEPRRASYLMQTACFHSIVHKQADHLSFLWHDRGRDVLVDPGRYAYEGRTPVGSDLFNQGFWYSDPKRVYVESTRAHNCVEIDGLSYPRRKARPWGSALVHAGLQEGLAVFCCEATHFRTVRHKRILVMEPGRFLLVLDWLNDRTRPHDYRQWLQFAPEWALEKTEAGRAEASAPATAALERGSLSIFNLIEENSLSEPVRGRTEPQLQGWISKGHYRFEPSASMAVEALDRPMARFATLFVFGAGVVVDKARTRFNASLRHCRIAWRDERRRCSLRLDAEDLGDPKTSFEVEAESAP